MSDFPTRTPAGTIYEIEAIQRDMDRRAYERTAAYFAKSWIWTRYMLDCQWLMFSAAGTPTWEAWLFRYFAPRIDPKRLLTVGDRLLPACSHPETVATYDHRVAPWSIEPPVGFTCLTCYALIPYAPSPYEVWINFGSSFARYH